MPTFTEQGYPGFESYSWVSLFLTGKTPSDITQRLAMEVGQILKQPDVLSKFNDMALDAGGMPQEQFAAQVAADYVRWATLIKKAGVKLD
ncbi:hypothetical protein LP416_10520 [Polaromonas sp. P2-4]|nr:hypothetical protein LP416_10520 [Polaromonas sp. P2-4]